MRRLRPSILFRHHAASTRATRTTFGSFGVTCVLLTVCLAWLAAPVVSAAPASDASAATTAASSTSDSTPSTTMLQLQSLMKLAPAREMGQPGATAVDQWVHQLFTNAVKAHNDKTTLASDRKMLAEVQKKQDELTDIRNDMAVPSEQVQNAVSSAIVNLTAERPMPAIIVSLLVFGMAFGAYIVQRRKGVLILALVSLVVAGGLPVLAWMVDTTYEKALRETRGVTEHGSQAQVASRALYTLNVKTAKALQGQWQSGQIHYPASIFVPGTAHLQGHGGKVRLYQMAADLVDPSNLPGLAFDGPLRYIGKATTEQMRNVDIRGAAVVMDFDTYQRWIDVAQLGARVVLFVQPDNDQSMAMNSGQANDKMTTAPLSVPRFYVKKDDLVKAIGSNWKEQLVKGENVKLSQDGPGRWITREASIDWLLIPAKSDTPQSGPNGDLSRQLIHIQASKDTASIVPELSPGATSAANLIVLKQLLEHFKAHPPVRPVLLSAIAGHTMALQGEAEFAHFAFDRSDSIFDELTQDQMELAQQVYINDLHNVTDKPIDTDRIEYMRIAAPTVAGQVLKANKTILDVLRSKRNTIRDARHLAVLDQKQHGTQWSADRLQDYKNSLAKLDAGIASLVKFMGLFNRFGTKTYFSEVTPDEAKELSSIFGQISGEASLRASQIRRAIERTQANLALRSRLLTITKTDVDAYDVSRADFREIFDQTYPPLPATLMLNLDLTFGENQVGFFAIDNLLSNAKLDTSSIQRVSRMARYTLEVANQYAKDTGKPNLLTDTIRNVGGVPWNAYLGSHVAFGSRMYQILNMTALTLTTIHDARPLIFTPWDTADRINPTNFNQVMDFAVGYIPRLVNAPELNINRRLVGRSDSLTVQLNIRQQDEFSVSVPQTPVPNAQVVIWGLYNPLTSTRMMYGDVRPYPILTTDQRGVAMLRNANWRGSTLSVYKYNDNFTQLISSLDMGEGSKRFTATIQPSSSDHYVPRTFVAFDSRKIDLLGLTEPLLLNPVVKLEMFDAKQDSMPIHFGVVGATSISNVKSVPLSMNGSVSIFIEPHAGFKTRAGQGLLINATPEAPTGVGFEAKDSPIRDTVLTSANDMWQLTHERLSLLASKGVTNDTAIAYNKDAKAKLDASRASLKEGHNEEHLIQAEEARGLGFRAYTQALTTINDLIKAVVIFLALVIPFCFFLTKLVSPFTDINRQLAMFAAIFVGMAVLLWLVHPAFKIASTPAVVILAFVIMGLAIFVSAILLGRFNASMNQAVEEALGSESADAPQGRLMGVAFLVGINNMKRRRIRTTLTCVTIILVTFTMLSVISVGQDVEPARVRLSSETNYSGFLFTRPGMAPIDPLQHRRLKAHFQDQSQQIISRVWVERKGIYGDYLPYDITPAKQMPNAAVTHTEAKVIVGMEVGEDGFTGSMPIAKGGRWFSSNEAPEIILSVQAANLLGITPDNLAGQMIIINGKRLKLVGLLKDDRFAAMNDQDELPLSPLLTQAKQELAGQSDADAASGAEALDASGDLMSAPGIEPARPMDIAIVPLDVARAMSDSNFVSLSVKFINPPGSNNPALASEKALDVSRHFIRYQHARLYLGLQQSVKMASTGRTLESGQYSLTSSSSTQVGGILKVAIPIILAATIILNTMLGSVMERRREVAIYNAIGLNPGHVMAFFLAESLVFGMIGAVAGYLIGQILSMAITYFDIVSLNLNYSSLSVMVVIFLTIGTVMISTVYPAMMAARAAVPSGQRRWALPQPQGDQIYLQFPFSYDATRVKGVCAYLREFMHQNSEASTGQFLAKLGPVGTVPADPASAHEDSELASATNYAMLFDIAPAPFDLGVNQTMEVYAYYDSHVKAHMLAVYLTRTSGETSNWKTVNQPFLESLRKRLLGWRSQRPETHQAYYRQGEQLFTNTAALPIMAAVTAASSQGDR